MALNSVVIAGGGLAGLSLGIALRHEDVPVRIVEAAAYPRHRVCGEFVSGIKTKDLTALGIEDLFRTAHRHQETAWFDGAALMLRAQLPEVAYGLSRYELDAALAERFMSLQGELQTGTRFTAGGSEGIVLASGRVQSASPWLGLKAHFHELPLSADLEVHLGKSAYVGLTRVEGGRVNVTGLFKRSTPISGGQQALAQATLEAGLAELAERLRSSQIDDASLKGVNRFQLGWQIRHDDAVRIGDAAALIPPFTGNGMTMALQSALSAVQPLTLWSRGERSWRETHTAIHAAHTRLFSSRLRWAHAMQAVLLHPLGRRLCGSMLRHKWLSFDTLYHKLR